MVLIKVFLDMMFVTGGVGLEGLSLFKNDQGSFLAVANEVSETTSLYRVAAVSGKSDNTQLLLGCFQV